MLLFDTRLDDRRARPFGDVLTWLSLVNLTGGYISLLAAFELFVVTKLESGRWDLRSSPTVWARRFARFVHVDVARVGAYVAVVCSDDLGAEIVTDNGYTMLVDADLPTHKTPAISSDDLTEVRDWITATDLVDDPRMLYRMLTT